MRKFYLSGCLLLAAFTLLTAQTDYLRFYGEAFAADDESSFSVEKVGGQPVIIGQRQNQDGSYSLGGYVFDPQTGEETGDFLLPEVTGLLLFQQTYPTPDGGFLAMYYRVGSGLRTSEIAYVDADLSLRWQVPAPTDFDRVVNVTFDRDETMLLLYTSNGTEVGVNTRAARYATDDGAARGSVDVMRFGSDAPLSITPLADGGYLVAGMTAEDRTRAFVRRTDDDFADIWVDYTGDMNGGRMFSASSATQRPSGEIWATGYVGVAFDGARGLLRYDADGTVLSKDIVRGRAGTVEKVTWGENTFSGQTAGNGFTISYSVIAVPEGANPSVVASFDGGAPDAPEEQFSDILYLEDQELLFAVIDYSFTNAGDLNMTVDRIEVAEGGTTERLEFGTDGANQDETARQMIMHPNGEDLILLAFGGRPGGRPAGTQLTVVDPAEGDVRRVTYPSKDGIFQSGREFVDTLPNGNLLVGEALLDTLAMFELDANLEVVNKWRIARDNGGTFKLSGLSLSNGEIVVNHPRYNPDINSSDHRLIFYGADGSENGSIFALGDLDGMIELNDEQIITYVTGFDDTTLDLYGELQSINVADRRSEWRQRVSISGCRRALVTSVRRLADERLAAAIFGTGCGGPGVRMEYQVFDREGNLEESSSVTSTALYLTDPILSEPAADAEIAMSFAENAEVGESQLRIVRLDSRSGAILRDSVMTGFGDRAIYVEDLRYLEGNRLAVMGTVSDNQTFSNDLFLLATDAGKLVSSREILAGEDLTVGPNPTDGQLNVELNNARGGNYQLRVLDVNGRQLTERWVRTAAGTSSEAFDLTGAPAGVYLLTVTDGKGGRATRRFVKAGR